MVGLTDFKKYLGYSSPKILATPAIGILTLTKKGSVPADTAVPIPAGLVFATGNLFFESGSDDNPKEINESQMFVPYVVKASQNSVGAKGNVLSARVWAVDQGVQFNIGNSGPFTGGADEIPATPGYQGGSDFIQTDDVLQRCIDSATAQVRARLGLTDDEAIPDFPQVDQATLLLSTWHSEQNSTAERRFIKNIVAPEGVENPAFTLYPRPALHSAIMRQVDSLICNFKKIDRFVPPYTEVASESA